MDYFKKIEESIKFAWENKQLWWFGFLIALFGGGVSFRYSSSSSGNSSDATEFSTKLNDSLHQPAVIIALVCLGVLAIVIALIGWYVSSVSQAALVQAVILDRQGSKMKFREGWKYGKTKAFKIMMLDLILFLFVLGLFIVLIPFFIITTVFPPLLICLCCVIIPVVFLGLIPLLIIKMSAIRYIVIKNMTAWESIKTAWKSIKKAYAEYAISAVITLIFAVIMFGIYFMLLLLPAILILIVFVALVLVSPLIGFIFIAVVGLSLMLIITAFESPFIVGIETFWTKVIMELMDKYDSK